MADARLAEPTAINTVPDRDVQLSPRGGILTTKLQIMSLLAIVGRPNVGKSTLFNRLVGMRQAIVDETAGVTRDRHYGRCEWCGTEFSVVDTGGYTSNSDDIFEEEIRKQVVLAIEEAHVVLFMVEAGTGITDYDEEIADILRRSGKPVILAVNKIDSGEKMYDAFQFYSLGLGRSTASLQPMAEELVICWTPS